MSEYIGDVAITSIQEVQMGDAVDIEEIDPVNKDQKHIFTGDKQGTNIEISGMLIEQIHPMGLSVEEQRKQLKSLSWNGVTDNVFKYRDNIGFISVEDIDVSETSDAQTYREATVSGIYFPWPKNFPDVTPTTNIELSGSMDMTLKMDEAEMKDLDFRGTFGDTTFGEGRFGESRFDDL